VKENFSGDGKCLQTYKTASYDVSAFNAVSEITFLLDCGVYEILLISRLRTISPISFLNKTIPERKLFSFYYILTSEI